MKLLLVQAERIAEDSDIFPFGYAEHFVYLIVIF
jgi:hypothetical protein